MARDENEVSPFDLFELGARIVEMMDRLATMDKVVPGASATMILEDDESGLRFIISARVDRSCPKKETDDV